jgi:hypothetical protein
MYFRKTDTFYVVIIFKLLTQYPTNTTQEVTTVTMGQEVLRYKPIKAECAFPLRAAEHEDRMDRGHHAA